MILDEIIAHKKEEVAAARRTVPLGEIQDRAQSAPPARDLRTALRLDGMSLIAEIKRASPSRGEIMPDCDAVELAALYEQAGARAISVLTDSKFFKGSLADLTAVRQNVSVPVLRKEFIIDDYQIFEARAASADAILLIVRCLNDEQLVEYIKVAQQLGMHALVETHNEEEIRRAVDARAHIIGINNRDLDTLEVDVNNTFALKRRVPGGHVLVSESGINERSQVKALEDGGVDAILVGESLMLSKDIRAKIMELLGRGEG